MNQDDPIPQSEEPIGQSSAESDDTPPTDPTVIDRNGLSEVGHERGQPSSPELSDMSRFESPSVTGTFAGRRFSISRSLGAGGFGHVVLAHDSVLGRDVAIKFLHAHHALDDSVSLRFLHEAQTVAKLDHPGIVPVFDWGNDDGISYIVMAYGPSGHLGQWHGRQERPVPVAVAAELVAMVAEAVDYAHEQKVIHRDLKPANILLFPRENAGDREFPFTPRVTDFGVAMRLEPYLNQKMGTSMLIGTPVYMAPEQAGRRQSEIGIQTDIYALGVILYQLLTGRPPHTGESYAEILDHVRNCDPIRPSKWRPDVDDDLEVICLTCLRREPRDRYHSAAALANDLRAFLSGNTISARRLNFRQRVRNWARHEKRLSESAVIITAINVHLLLFGVLGLVLLEMLGEIPHERLQLGWAMAFLSGVNIAVHGFNIWCAWRIAKRNLARTWWSVATACSAIWCMLTLLNAVGIINMIPTYEALPGGRVLAMLSVSLLFAIQTTAYVVAGAALRQYARITGDSVSPTPQPS